MKYNDTIELLKLFAKALIAPMSISNNLRKSDILNYSKDLESNNSMNNNIYVESENDNIEYNKSAPMEDGKSFYDNKSKDYYNTKKDTSSDPQGVMDSITQEITSVRLQQAIILSEIVGKPRSKTRRKRRF